MEIRMMKSKIRRSRQKTKRMRKLMRRKKTTQVQKIGRMMKRPIALKRKKSKDLHHPSSSKITINS